MYLMLTACYQNMIERSNNKIKEIIFKDLDVYIKFAMLLKSFLIQICL